MECLFLDLTDFLVYLAIAICYCNCSYMLLCFVLVLCWYYCVTVFCNNNNSCSIIVNNCDFALWLCMHICCKCMSNIINQQY